MLPHRIHLTVTMVILLSGCQTVMPPTFQEQASDYSRTMEQYHIDSIFTNVIRAHNSSPLSFHTIDSVVGNASTDSGLSLNNSFKVQDKALDLWGITRLGSATFSPSQSYSTGFSFTQTGLQNATFIKQLIKPFPLEEVRYLFSQDVGPEILSHLLLQSLIVTGENEESVIFHNDPRSPEYAEFVNLLQDLLARGLSIHQSTAKSDPNASKTPSSNVLTRFCLRKASLPNSPYKFSAAAYCDASGIPEFGKSSLTILTRSPKQMFEYVGNVVTAQLRSKPTYVTLDASADEYSDDRGDKGNHLLVVKKNPELLTKRNAFAYCEDPKSDQYIIPNDNFGHSKKVISLLSELFTFSVVPDAIAPSPAIVIQ